MADVMTDAASRGQLLLITGLALAVILVTVALLLNAAIFTENIATRDTTVDGREAIELRGDVVSAVGDLIETGNWQGDHDPAAVEGAVNATAPLVDREHGRHGTIATVTLNGNTTGTLLRSNSRSEFTDDGGIKNWTLVDGVSSARNFSVSVDSGSLETPTPAAIEDEAFGVRFVNTSTENVTQYIYEDGGDVVIAEANESHGPTRQCTIAESSEPTTVDLSGNRLSTDDETVDCYRGLWTTEETDAIRFINGNNATGEFAVTVDDGASPIADGDVQTTDAVYAITVDIAYRTRELVFETTTRIAPGEPR